MFGSENRAVSRCPPVSVWEASTGHASPATAAAVYVRITVDSEITSTLGTFAGSQRIASWLVRRAGGRWLVAGSFEGG